ncbi:hypothetical protein ACL02S_23510 [Nocardia sp. 004]|uniref:hypothetical protein n=1 Tax=Nocardia sp. 004 TaxID=3385978 RepID=UPI0039A03D47
MSDPLDALEKSITELRRLRRAIRDSCASGDTRQASELRAQLRRTERAGDALIAPDEPPTTPPDLSAILDISTLQGMLLPAREHVHRALMLLRTPATPKLIIEVHQAFFPGELSASKLSSLRRDEERSYRTAPCARPYYLRPALTHDLLPPARASLTISTWPLEQGIIGPLSRRVDFLTNTIHIAEAVHAAAESTHTPAPLQRHCASSHASPRTFPPHRKTRST